MRIGVEFWRNGKRKTSMYLSLVILLQACNTFTTSSLLNSNSTSSSSSSGSGSGKVEFFLRLYPFDSILFGEDATWSSVVNGEIVLRNEELNNLIDDGCTTMSEETKRKRTDFVREALAHPEYSKMREHLAEIRSKASETPDEPVPEKIANAVMEMKQVDRSGDTNLIHDVPSVKAINSDIADLLIGGDMILSNDVMEEHDAATLSNIDPAKKRRKRQLQTAWYRKWSRDSSISYFFDYSIDDNTRRLIRLAAQYWTNNTCMTFVENAQTRPSIRFFKGQGCYSDVGRARLARQSVSIGAGCELFGTIAHELGHVLGMFHHQSRTDRDNYVTLMLDAISPYWRAQYAKEFASQNLDIEYDLGSIMHYSGYKPHTDTIEMAANDKRYQHTMGNNYGPIFTDLVLINKYYSCHDRCPNGANCQNGGFRNSRNCDVCICPNGFGSADCSQRAPGEGGAPDGCGETVEAESGWKTLSGKVMAGPLPPGKNLSDLWAGCHFHIKSPDGTQIEVEVLSIVGTCSPDCYFGALEIKFNSMVKGGVRLCCDSHKTDVSVLTSSSNLVIASLYTQREKREFSLRYRILDTETSTRPTTETPIQATASSPLRSPIDEAEPITTSSTTTTTGAAVISCVDSGGFLCFARGVRFRCRFRRQTRQLCRRTCGLC